MVKRIDSAEREEKNRPLRPDARSDAPLSKRKRRSDAKRPTGGDLARIESLIAVGMPMDVVAAECEVSTATLERWARDYYDIAAAIRKGRKKRKIRAYTCLFEQAFPVEKKADGRVVPTGKGNPDLMKFWFRTREGVSERVAEEKALRKIGSGSDADTENNGVTIVYNLKEKAAPDPHEDDDGGMDEG